MGLKRRVVTAVKKSNVPAWGAGLALAATYALAMFLEAREQDRAPAAKARGTAPARTARPGEAIGSNAEQKDAPKPIEAESGWPFWKALGLRLYERTNDDRLLALAAGVVFFSLLALFPAITALVSSYALFADVGTIGQHLNALSGLMPASAWEIVQEQVTRIVGNTKAGLSFAFVFGLGFAIWSANAGIKAMIDALNIAYDVKERRNFIMLNAVSLSFTVGAIVSLLLAIGAIVVVPVMLSFLPFDGMATILKWLRWPVLAVLVILGLAILYRFGPDHVHPRWRWISPGAIFAAVTWLAASALLSWYLANFADYNATYGSLGAAIGLMMWMWISTIVVLLGAEINCELDYAADNAGELAERAGVGDENAAPATAKAAT
jgi:membrane protein